MENVTWGAVPTQRKRKEEKYSTPVLTMSALSGKGAGRKFTFNKAAQELLGLVGEENIQLGYPETGSDVYLKVAKEGLKLTKSCTFSDKKSFEYISKKLELNNDLENDFDVTVKDSYFKLTLKVESTDVVIDFPEEKVEEVVSEKSEIPEDIVEEAVIEEETNSPKNVAFAISEEAEDIDTEDVW